LFEAIKILEGKYIGDIEEGKMHGYGKLFDKEENLVYEGEFSNN
jgi:hypothetical protein